MIIKVRLAGIEPKKEPTRSDNGCYTLEFERPQTVGRILARFGLNASGLLVLRNGNHADVDDPVADNDELNIYLMHLGG